MKNNNLGKFAIAAIAGPILMPISAPVLAADTRANIEEITVTARRRDESVQEVPVAISVFSGAKLEQLGAADIIEIGKLSPNVTLEVSRGTNTTLTAFIRGVGQQDPVAGFEAGVGIYVDDVYFNRPHAGVLDLYEVERIEVLRGPQGTLYGRNTIGGAIKYVTKKLSDEPTFKTRFSAGSYGQLDATISGSVPIGDTFRVGATFAKFTRDGFGDNLNLSGLDNYNKDITGLRLSAEWDITDSLFLRVAADKLEDDSDPKHGHRLQVGGVSGAPILSNPFDTRAGLNTPKQEVEADGYSVVLNYQLSDQWSFKAIYADRDDETQSPIDFDSLPAADLDVPVVYENEQTSFEFLATFEGAKLNGTMGYYQLDANAFNEFDVVLGQLGTLISLPGLNANTLGDVDTDTWAVFADFTYDLSDQWSLSLGGRYTVDERSARILRRTFIGGFSETFGGNATLIATTSDFNDDEEFKEFSPRLSLSYYMNDQHHLYFTYSEGFKGGGFDPRGQTSAAPDLNLDGTVSAAEVFDFLAFDPETVTSYELGWKATWLDNAVQTNLAVFYGDYEDVQVPGSVGIDTTGDGLQDTFAGITTNAGEAELPGFEFEGIARASDNWSFTWAIGYLDAEYKEFIDGSGQDVSSQAEFQNTPEWTGNLGVTYERELSLFGIAGDLTVINSVSYRDDSTQFEFPNPLLDQDAYTLWDLSVVWADQAGHWRAGLHGKNLSDKEYIVAGYNFPSLGLEGNITGFYGNPRTVTGTIEYRF